MTDEPDFIRAKRKLNKAKKWRGTVNVSLGDETVEFAHCLLNESELLDLKQTLDMSAIDDDNVGQTDAQERLLELQEKDELTPEEESELDELTAEVAAQTDSIEEALGEDGYDKLMEMGKQCIRPTEEDIQKVYDADPTTMRQYMGVETLPNPITEDAIETELTNELSDMIGEQPYPIKLNVGLQAFSETLSVLGNGLQT